ncbi:hypothetical protein BO82DRAFT_363518 [Aspergillus uvarum CBS 121591]|uniref:Uncharacterized protein n=1 Tax=Aspergillus uvarum CBS 121591 TaxID=1448315 RepID=A0A319CG25_9EURO|nr:hypothetical protein BO82DRAFT_363518 [Aspergillus uvarum CBS 121591]PYH83340.1 hypothetical protein BO82DRAFT_363518 [Aspergillus uvarum CBS 121591]
MIACSLIWHLCEQLARCISTDHMTHTLVVGLIEHSYKSNRKFKRAEKPSGVSTLDIIQMSGQIDTAESTQENKETNSNHQRPVRSPKREWANIKEILGFVLVVEIDPCGGCPRAYWSLDIHIPISVTVCGQRRASAGAGTALHSLPIFELNQANVEVRVRGPSLEDNIATSLSDPDFTRLTKPNVWGVTSPMILPSQSRLIYIQRDVELVTTTVVATDAWHLWD